MSVLLRYPKLARCNDRSVTSRFHPNKAHPEEWWDVLKFSGSELRFTAFDFFIDWSTGSVADDIWIKRIVETATHPIDNQSIMDAITKCDGRKFIESSAAFASWHSLRVNYLLFRDRNDWGTDGGQILRVLLSKDQVENLEFMTIDALKDQIRKLSGGPVAIGRKGLIYGTSTLECYLSRTDAAWPGDADLVPITANGQSIAIVEFKKHNLRHPVENETFATYYPNPDARKYDRLSSLSLRLSPKGDCPVIVVHFPTLPAQSLVHVERLGGSPGALQVVEDAVFEMPNRDDQQGYFEAASQLLAIAGR